MRRWWLLGNYTGSLLNFLGPFAENEHHTGVDKLVMHCKHFPGLLASDGSLEQASAELDRTYEQVSCP